MESRNVRLTRCGICGALKAEGQPCRFCDEASPEDLPGDGPRTAATPASSGRDAWRELQESGMDEFATAQDAGGADSEGEPTAEPVGAAKARRSSVSPPWWSRSPRGETRVTRAGCAA